MPSAVREQPFGTIFKSLTVQHRSSGEPGLGPDGSLIADCRAVTAAISNLIYDIDQAAVDGSDDRDRDHRLSTLREADAAAFRLLGGIADTRAVTVTGVQSKQMVVHYLLDMGWYEDPSPVRDAVLLSFLQDATRLRYPEAADRGVPAVYDPDANAVIELSNSGLNAMQELGEAFALRDQCDELGQPEPDDLDNTILVAMGRKRAAINALAKTHAASSAALSAKCLALKRMLETGYSDAHQLRVDLARSLCDDLDAFGHADTCKRTASVLHGGLWQAFSSRFRRSTSTVSHG